MYYYFPKAKEELAAATIKLMGDKIQNEIEEELAKNGDPVQAIQEFILDIARKFKEKDKKSFFFYQFAVPGDSLDKRVFTKNLC